MWTHIADRAGIPRFTFFAVFGALIERGEDHRRIFEIFGITPDRAGWALSADDFYPDALPCLRVVREMELAIGVVGNTSQEIEKMLRGLELPVDFVGSSQSWRVEKPSPEFFSRVVEVAGTRADRVAYVGDRLDNDVLPAVDAGMNGVFIRRGPWGVLHALRPEVERATARIDTLDELPGVLLER
jgi:FMN phosphatase YigB (HAD superfamily)